MSAGVDTGGGGLRADLPSLTFAARGVVLRGVAPLVDGTVPRHEPPKLEADRIAWPLETGRAVLDVTWDGEALRLDLRLEDWPADRALDSLGLRFVRVEGAERYFRNGYQSWDGSWFVRPGEPDVSDTPARSPHLGFAVAAFAPPGDAGAVVLGFTRHDRFQTRFRFSDREPLVVDAETLWDRVPHGGRPQAEPLVLFEREDAEAGLRAWSRMVAAQSPLPPRVPERRITGWCSWYNLYAAIDEASILEHLAAAARFRDAHGVPLDVFLIDDGFTPEMGDWLEVKPQFPRGMAPLIADIAAAGFTPGLWIAPFLVGNRSRLFRDHPDWVVRERATGQPLAHMRFYGEFRWHKRSEEYYVLDVTHPQAEAYIRRVFRAWRDWGCGYFKTDFMLAGAEYGPDRAVWHEPGLSRIAVWRRMAGLIREEIGEALWLGCGCPLWAAVGLVDAVRIGRDVGVAWKGDQSAESLLRDQVTRNHASGVLWQADPDCILLRERFHELSDDQVRSLALFAGLSGGVLMTSDRLDDLRPDRARLFAALLRETGLECDFPAMAAQALTGVIAQQARRPDGGRILSLFNTRGAPAEVTLPDGAEARLAPYASRLVTPPDDPLAVLEPG